MGDIIASTDNATLLNAVFKNELTVTYDIPKPNKTLVTEQALFNADLFTFGSQIGALTNKSTNAYALLPILENKYGKNSEQANIIVSRLKQCCVAQSKQIDL